MAEHHLPVLGRKHYEPKYSDEYSYKSLKKIYPEKIPLTNTLLNPSDKYNKLMFIPP